jgi:integrase
MVSGRVARSKTKTKRGNRLLRIDPDVVDALRVWRAVQKEQRMLFRKQWDDDRGHVFTHEVRFSKPVRYGVAIRPDWLSSKFRQYAKGASLPPLRLHGLRHSYVTTAAEQGVSSRDIADSVGHSSPAVLERYYRHTFERVQETASAQVAGAIREARAGGA